MIVGIRITVMVLMRCSVICLFLRMHMGDGIVQQYSRVEDEQKTAYYG